jgi:hypothetical protein
MNHTGITSNCASCHETGMSWFGVTMVDRPTAAQDPNHPKTGDCSGCHTSTTSFNTAVTKPANHIPTTQACALCHTNASNFAIYTMNHAGIASGCATCHGKGLSFANIVPKEPPPNHIPTGGIACESCHAATNFTTFGGTAMNHVPVAAMACDACHETGMSWYGVQIVDRPPGHHTGVDCKGCHNPGGGFTATRKAGATPATKAMNPRAPVQTLTAGSTAAIGAATTASAPTLRTLHFDHLQAAGACVRCHNGIQATGKGPRHIQSDSNCDNCHTTIAWAPARFDHQSTALRTCQSCHNGIQASGKPAMHVVTSAQCNSCHSTIAWLPARFDHSLAVGACASCHNGVHASGKPVNHIATTADCVTCHVSSTWYRKPAVPAPTNPPRKGIRP